MRDLKQLDAAGYKLRTVVPVDMFPHTHHIETVVILDRHRPRAGHDIRKRLLDKARKSKPE